MTIRLRRTLTPMTAKPTAPGWISARHLRHFVAHGEAAGLRMDELLGNAGVGRDKLADADGLIPLAAVESMLQSLSGRYADPLIGLHMASDIQPASFGALGFILQACTKFSDVLDVATRYSGLLSNIGKTSLVHGPGTAQLCWECAAGGEALRRHATEYVLGAFVVLARLLLPGRKGLLLSVNFAHARPDDPELARKYFAFFQCPVYFGKPVSSVTLPASALNTRLRHGDAFIKDLLERHARNQLQQRKLDTSFADQVRHLIGAMVMEGTPTKEMVAMQLGISSRSLHRKLQDLGTSYREILDRVRLDAAHERLREGADSISQISAHLGFSSHQAFLRWFKQSTGMTPGEYRKQQAATPARSTRKAGAKKP
ncbi:MAG: AraC family transcriptional regulator [Stenotrophobium sp.]